MLKKGCLGQRRLLIYCIGTGAGMPEEIENGRELRIVERSFGGWRIVVAAWLVAIVFVVLFAGVQALASRHGVSPAEASLAGVVIPRHDPSCAGPALAPVSPSCQADVENGLERAEASYYGW
jgi:hypothetical protein